MPFVTGPNDSDPAETIHRAVYVAKSSTVLARLPDAGEDVHADPAETLRLISAFTQIEDFGVRDMLLQVTEVLADAKTQGFDA